MRHLVPMVLLFYDQETKIYEVSNVYAIISTNKTS